MTIEIPVSNSTRRAVISCSSTKGRNLDGEVLHICPGPQACLIPESCHIRILLEPGLSPPQLTPKCNMNPHLHTNITSHAQCYTCQPYPRNTPDSQSHPCQISYQYLRLRLQISGCGGGITENFVSINTSSRTKFSDCGVLLPDLALGRNLGLFPHNFRWVGGSPPLGIGVKGCTSHVGWRLCIERAARESVENPRGWSA